MMVEKSSENKNLKSELNTGSSEYQIERFTNRIKLLTEHLSTIWLKALEGLFCGVAHQMYIKDGFPSKCFVTALLRTPVGPLPSVDHLVPSLPVPIDEHLSTPRPVT